MTRTRTEPRTLGSDAQYLAGLLLQSEERWRQILREARELALSDPKTRRAMVAWLHVARELAALARAVEEEFADLVEPVAAESGA